VLRHWWTAVWRRLARPGSYPLISIGGLAIGVCTALVCALVVYSQSQYDTFIPGYERTYLAFNLGAPRDQPFTYSQESSSRLAGILRLQFPQIEAVARLASDSVTLRSPRTTSKESIYWADPAAFEVLPLPVLAGDLQTALQRPDSIVLVRALAHKYFRTADAVGRILQVGTHAMTVTAVIEDLPVNATQLESGAFASGVSSYSRLTALDRSRANGDASPAFSLTVRTYLRLPRDDAPGTLARLQQAIPELAHREWPLAPPIVKMTVQFVRLDRVHTFAPFNPGFRGRQALLIMIGSFTLLIAAINFVNLLTALSLGRAKEVAVRKVTGASRGALIVQYLGEALGYTLVAVLLGLALTEWVIPHVNAYLVAGARPDYWRQGFVWAWLAVAALSLALLIGTYPAFVLSAFRPAAVLSGRLSSSSARGGLFRQALIGLQFAILIGLASAAAVVLQQHRYATHDALRFDVDQTLIIRAPCGTAFDIGLRSLPGVSSAACSGRQLLGENSDSTEYIRPDGSFLTLQVIAAEPGMFGIYDVKPIAGALPLTSSADSRGMPSSAGYVPNRPYVLNETAVRLLAMQSPETAIGQSIRTRSFGGPIENNQVIGVVPDFSLGSIEHPIAPTAYVVDPQQFSIISVRLVGRTIPETLVRLDRLWTETGNAGVPDRFFLSRYLQGLYLSIQRQAQAFELFALVAGLLSCLGLVGLAAAIAEQRTKEIGIRKAMGASTLDVLRLLLWQFTQPVLAANLLAWPVVGYLMRRWLHGFAYHVDLSAWLFVVAALAAWMIALCTVAVHAALVARARPVTALRYE
jgi:putative ABC transport system permease protein